MCINKVIIHSFIYSVITKQKKMSKKIIPFRTFVGHFFMDLNHWVPVNLVIPVVLVIPVILVTLVIPVILVILVTPVIIVTPVMLVISKNPSHLCHLSYPSHSSHPRHSRHPSYLSHLIHPSHPIQVLSQTAIWIDQCGKKFERYNMDCISALTGTIITTL